VTVDLGTAGLSWIPLCKYTDGLGGLKVQNSNCGSESEAKERIDGIVDSVPLTERSNRTLRKDVVVPVDGLHLPTDLGFAINRFDEYIDSKDGQQVIMQEMNSGKKKFINQYHRFEKGARKKTMGQFYAVEREAVEAYGEDNLVTVMLTLSASIFRSDGRLVPIVDHLDSMVDKDVGSWAAVKSSLHRILSDYDWEYMRMLEPHTPDKGLHATAGYTHQHIALMIRDPNKELQESDFKPALDAHVRNCETAGSSAHSVDKAVSLVEYDPEKSLGSYLTSYMGKMVDKDVRDAPHWFKRFLTMLWASNRRRVSFSQGANAWKRRDRERDGYIDFNTVDPHELDSEDIDWYVGWVLSKIVDDWQMVGLKTSDGDIIECEGGGGGGSYLTDTAYPDDYEKYRRRLLSLPGEI